MKLSGRTPHIPQSAATEFHLEYLLPVPEMGVPQKSTFHISIRLQQNILYISPILTDESHLPYTLPYLESYWPALVSPSPPKQPQFSSKNNLK